MDRGCVASREIDQQAARNFTFKSRKVIRSGIAFLKLESGNGFDLNASDQPIHTIP